MRTWSSEVKPLAQGHIFARFQNLSLLLAQGSVKVPRLHHGEGKGMTPTLHFSLSYSPFYVLYDVLTPF